MSAAASSGMFLETVTKSYETAAGESVTALASVSLGARPGEITCVVGPTGSGKTTALRLLAGLDAPDGGSVKVGGAPPGSMRGKIGYLAQKHTLLPWRRMLDNVALPLELAGIGRAERTSLAMEAISSLGLSGSESRYPHELSGGMQQRAAIARLLVSGAQYWLLDEPFAALDERTRRSIERLLIGLIRKHRQSVVMVTHSIDEAVFLGDRIVVLSAGPGRVVETMDETLPHPRDRMDPSFGNMMDRVRLRLESVIEAP